jgi:hypothetical protein
MQTHHAATAHAPPPSAGRRGRALLPRCGASTRNAEGLALLREPSYAGRSRDSTGCGGAGRQDLLAGDGGVLSPLGANDYLWQVRRGPGAVVGAARARSKAGGGCGCVWGGCVAAGL